MEDSPTLLGRIRLSSVGEAPLVIGDSHELGPEACVYCSGGRPKLVNACGGRPQLVVGVVGNCGGTGCVVRKCLPSFRLTCYLLLSEVTQVLLLVGRARLIAWRWD